MSIMRTPRATGFTIVELLIVVVIIAILAVITVVAYNGANARTNASAIRTDLRNIAAKITLYQVDTGSYPIATTAGLNAAGFDITTNQYGQGYYNGAAYYNLLYCRNNDNTSFALIAWSKTSEGLMFSNGTVSAYAGAPAGMATICPAVGISAYTAMWMYAAGAWQLT